MKILVIGATGLTGSHLLKHLLAGGHDVTAFVRDPAKLPLQHARLKIAQGEARDSASLERAVKGQDAVMSAFGPRSLHKDDLQGDLHAQPRCGDDQKRRQTPGQSVSDGRGR